MNWVQRRKIRGNIGRYGQHVVGVYRSADDPPDFEPFVYTIGNHQLGLPELILVGDDGDIYVRIVNAVGRAQREGGKPLVHGDLVDYTAPLPALIVEAGQRGRDYYAVQAGVYYGTERFEVRQILLPDPNGRFPGDPECVSPFADQLRILPVS